MNLGYIKSTERTCDRRPCTKRARREVFNAANASLGRYCADCARKSLAEYRRSILERSSRAGDGEQPDS